MTTRNTLLFKRCRVQVQNTNKTSIWNSYTCKTIWQDYFSLRIQIAKTIFYERNSYKKSITVFLQNTAILCTGVSTYIHTCTAHRHSTAYTRANASSARVYSPYVGTLRVPTQWENTPFALSPFCTLAVCTLYSRANAQCKYMLPSKRISRPNASGRFQMHLGVHQNPNAFGRHIEGPKCIQSSQWEPKCIWAA